MARVLSPPRALRNRGRVQRLRREQVDLVKLHWLRAPRVWHALRASGLLERHPEIELACSALGIWGRAQLPSEPLRDRDRVEVYRPLPVDPKEARRLRYRAQAYRQGDCGAEPQGRSPTAVAMR